MQMEVLIPSPAAADFHFDSASTSPYISAPSSPQRFGSSFYSAPTSPTRISAFLHAGDAHALSAVPFDWEEKPGIPKAKEAHISTATSSIYGDAEEELQDIDFAFDFSGQLERSSLSADELFDGGKIKPLKPPPRFQYDQNRPLDSPKSPRSPKKIIREAFSPRHRRKDFDPFAAALEQTRKENDQQNMHDKRGRERTSNSSSTAPGSRNKNSRSLSPFRVSDLLFDPEEPAKNPSTTSNNSLFSSSSFSSFWYKKWKIKDLLLFRSASESRATDQEQLKKFALLKKTRQDDVKNSSFRSTDSAGSVSSRRRPGGAPISAHELHYTVNRAVSEEMKKRTFLPYKQGLLGCLGFHPTVPEISKGLSPTGSLPRG
ncbi:uncharacterized protein LOC105169569 [Sesamum indicum]|uniref:Uncharacterized protein LOC105169569 n=1 Tax=Sesamum indicum TaxID=4182 RepID=A0A6I9U3A1_SESIN|nr:uncharacterized protein LOC105169569 [Sesamum indicum]